MERLRVPVVMGLLFAVLWIAGGGASAQPYPPPTPTGPTVIPSHPPSPTAPPSDGPTVPPSVAPSRGPTPVPFTGADLTRFVLIGAGLTLLGAGIVRVARRSSGS